MNMPQANLAQRIEQYLPDGQRVFAAPLDIVTAWRQHTTLIPAQYALGTAQHETSFALNEVDTETSGYVSKGIYQLADSEAADVGFDRANLLELEDATIVFSALCEKRLKVLARALNLGLDALPSDIWAYLAIAHNQGLQAALKTLRLHGLDWAAYKQRNPTLTGIAAYGDDVISGGEKWTHAFELSTPGST
jgi:hypothetical protein